MQQIKHLGRSLSTLQGVREAMQILVVGAQEAIDAQVTNVMRARLETSLRLCFPQTAEGIESGDEAFGTEDLGQDVDETFENSQKTPAPGSQGCQRADSQYDEPNPMLDGLEELIKDARSLTGTSVNKDYPVTQCASTSGDGVGHNMPEQQSTSIGEQSTSRTFIVQGSSGEANLNATASEPAKVAMMNGNASESPNASTAASVVGFGKGPASSQLAEPSSFSYKPPMAHFAGHDTRSRSPTSPVAQSKPTSDLAGSPELSAGSSTL
ncbi:hypothetical protein LTS18_006576 [Coniosporium uncinatum]|uniref:Uncharacterized protein n=1 Tax=Coniosporium uncinatum TaxID=93489 RepID=A0ACC3DXS3_9PEZI|nr:hypothetical protein LTS18_006576 [Coniosporium uncinatum]